MVATTPARSQPSIEPTTATAVLGRLRESLGRSASFRQLPKPQQQRMEHDLTRVMTYLTDPAAGQPHLAQAAARVQSPLAIAAGTPERAAQVTKQMVDAVAFPAFVKSLIDGVFNSIVESSIRQMHEYAKFLEAVVKSVNEFAQDHVSQSEARDFVVDKFPAAFKLNTKGDGLEVKDEDALPDLKSQFGIEGEIDVGDEQGQRQLVEAAQLRLARMRQQQLASMVLLGINRIVVTDGHINAKVEITVTGHEEFTGERTSDDTTSYDYSKQDTAESASRSFWGTSSSKRKTVVNTQIKAATKDTSKYTSDQSLDAKAKLTGEVKINFKSETFPLEKLASPSELTSIDDKSKKTS
jgi:hypothetical protein